MNEVPEATEAPSGIAGSEKDAWDKTKIVLYGFLVAAVIVGGWYYRGVLGRRADLRQHNVEMLRVAVDILREDPEPHRRPLREWAVATMDTFSQRTGVPLDSSARQILLDEPLTPAGPVERPGSRSWTLFTSLRQRLEAMDVWSPGLLQLLPSTAPRAFGTVGDVVSYVAEGGVGRHPRTFLPEDQAYRIVRSLADSLQLVRTGISRREFLNLPISSLAAPDAGE